MATVEAELNSLLDVLPPRIKNSLLDQSEINSLIEVVLDLGKAPEARFAGRVFYVPGENVLQENIDYIVSKIGEFTSDNRAGIERTLHRISCLRNRHGKIIGLTCRVGRSILGTVDVIRDVVESGKNTLFLGPPGI